MLLRPLLALTCNIKTSNNLVDIETPYCLLRESNDSMFLIKQVEDPAILFGIDSLELPIYIDS